MNQDCGPRPTYGTMCFININGYILIINEYNHDSLEKLQLLTF